jgi:hypothetical protein
VREIDARIHPAWPTIDRLVYDLAEGKSFGFSSWMGAGISAPKKVGV